MPLKDRFSLEPALALTRGIFAPRPGQAIFGSLGDSAPDTWGRRLMQRAERRKAEQESRTVRTLSETDDLLVSDETRLGALRFRYPDNDVFQAPRGAGVPPFVELGRLLQATERALRDEETDEDLQLIFAPGSSLGGARPKASIIDQHGQLSIAQSLKETDEYSIEAWEEVALRLAGQAGITTPHHELIHIGGKAVCSRAASIGLKAYVSRSPGGEHGSYPEIVDQLARHGGQYRRMACNILISNVDDHLRNHGFLWLGRNGWSLSPVYDLNPTPTDLEARILTIRIDLDEATCSVDLALSAADYFGLSQARAREIIKATADATAGWRAAARDVGLRPSEITRMASAFAHDDLTQALTLRSPRDRGH